MNVVEIQFLDKHIADELIKARDLRDSTHKSSGKLTASMLGQPLQWQILGVLGVKKELDEYTLRKFERGNQVEEWAISKMPGLVDTGGKQRWVDYKNSGGYLDSIVNMEAWNLPELGNIPNEVKSVTNMKYKRIVKEGKPDEAHCLQGTLYALGLGTEKFMITYLASDDFRVVTYLLDTKDYKDAVDKNIEEFNQMRAEHRVPVFKPTFGWTENDKYNSYLEFKDLSEEEIIIKLKTEYPEAYKKL